MQFLRSAAVIFVLAVSCFAQTFNKAEYPAGADPRGIAAGDFNGDGVVDLAVANFSANTVTVLTGRGDGTFNGGQTIAVAAQPTEIATGDLNGDGVPDIAVAGSGAVTVLYMSSGGSATRFDIGVGGRASSVAIGDFNRDGAPDIAAVVDGKVIALLNHGPQSFSVSATLALEVPAAVVRAADLNGDGAVDLAIGSCCQGTDVTYGAISTAIGHGDGTFTLNKLTDVSDGSKLTVADVTGDGRPDLVLPYVGCHTPCHGIEIQTNNGDGTFTRFGGGGDSLMTAAPGQAVVADFNLDGRMEVAAPFTPGDYEMPPSGKGYEKVIAWTVGSDGKFGTEADFALGANVGAFNTVTADFNHDGKADVAVSLQRTGKVAVLLNTTGNPGAHSDFELTLAFSPQTVTAGAKAQYQYLVEGTNGPLPAVQLSCSGLPQGTSCSFDGNPMGANLFGFLNITTTAQSSAALHSRSLLYFALLPFGFVALPGVRRKKALLLMLVMIGVMLLLAGCGGVSGNAIRMNGGTPITNTVGTGATGGSNSGGNSGGTNGTTSGGSATPAVGPTPSGTYQVTVTAISADVTRTVTITLVVK